MKKFRYVPQPKLFGYGDRVRVVRPDLMRARAYEKFEGRIGIVVAGAPDGSRFFEVHLESDGNSILISPVALQHVVQRAA